MNYKTELKDDNCFGAKGIYLGDRAPAQGGEDGPDSILVGNRGWRLDLTTYQLIHDHEGLATTDSADPTVLLKSVLLEYDGNTEEGVIVKRPRATWFEISKHLRQNPEFRFAFPAEPTAFEEFLAGAYHVDGWDAVILTPRSGDKGRDVIAVTTGLTTLRVLDQAKAYGQKNVIPADDVRALYGVLMLDPGASKAIVTTTSDFAPGITSEFGQAIPYRLELRNGKDLVKWIASQQSRDIRTGSKLAASTGRAI